jgi:hypothetical protein
MSTITLDYFLFVFAASLGVIQIAGSVGRLTGLLMLRPPVAARAAGLVLVAGALIWFFATDDRNLNDYEGGLDGNIQALVFFLAALSGLVATLVATTIVNAGMKGGNTTPGEGLEALKHTNYGRALARSIRYWWKEWRTQTRSYFSG